jgi:(p)ppGpp synthase/HD superfamily hydrolase
MLMQQLLEKAISIALQAHAGKSDKGGNPYILHPLRIMFEMATTEEKIVALLHDVVEDSSISLQILKQNKFSVKVLNAVALLTKGKDQSYTDYILAIKSNPLAKKVKLADLKDNMDKSRLKKTTESDKARLRKYRSAYKLLTTPNYS